MRKMYETALKYWIIFLSSLALFAAILGYFFQDTVKERQFSNTPNEVTPLAGRLYSTWTFLASVVRIIGSFYLHERGVCLILLSSFVVAFYFFMYEMFVSQTVPLKNAITPLIVSSISIVWLFLSLPPSNPLKKLK